MADFDERYRLQPDLWRDAVAELCELHAIPFRDFRTFGTESSNLIACVSGEFVVKVFPPFHRHQWESERRVLERIGSSGLSLPVPKLIAQGERPDTWTYVIMSRVPGQALEEVWPSLAQPEKAELLETIGRVMAQMHSIPVAGLSDLDPEWNGFLTGQREKCLARHRRLKMPEWFLAEVPQQVEESLAAFLREEPVILTGEYTPFNLLVDGGPGKWQLSGMIDFGDAMIGPREYDFDGPILFLCAGDPLLVDQLFRGYGLTSPRVDAALRRRLMLFAILHRYSNLMYQVRIPGVWEQVRSVRELEARVFAAQGQEHPET